MLRSITINGFKSLEELGPVELAPFSIIFGPNAAGKSNFLDAINAFSRLATERTLSDALEEGVIRGRTIEAFTFPKGGLPALLRSKRGPEFSFSADIVARATRSAKSAPTLTSARPNFRYEVGIGIETFSGTLLVRSEHLQGLTSQGKSGAEYIYAAQDGEHLNVRRSDKGRPYKEKLQENHTQLSDARFTGPYFRPIQNVRDELSAWRTYYLDPRTAMRRASAPQDVTDVGTNGEHLAPFLFRVKGQHPEIFDQIRRTLSAIIPSISNLSVELDERRGVVDVEIVQDEIPFSSRVVSEGTLRVLAMICVAVNPWAPRLVSIEEPENGVHPRRIEQIATLLYSLVKRRPSHTQLIVTTHSTTFCGITLRLAREAPELVRLYRAIRKGRTTALEPFPTTGPLFEDHEILRNLNAPDEERLIENLLLRGSLDA